MSWNPLRNEANEEAIEETKMAQSVQKVAYKAKVNEMLFKLALFGMAVTFLVTYRPAEKTIPAEKAPSIKRDTVKHIKSKQKHQKTPRCTWDPNDECNKKK